MFLTYVAYGLSGLMGLGIIFVGARFLLVPHAAAAAYGTVRRDGGGTDAFLAAKGVRDIASLEVPQLLRQYALTQAGNLPPPLRDRCL